MNYATKEDIASIGIVLDLHLDTSKDIVLFIQLLIERIEKLEEFIEILKEERQAKY